MKNRLLVSLVSLAFVLSSGCAMLGGLLPRLPADIDPLVLAQQSDAILDAVHDSEFQICFGDNVMNTQAKLGVGTALQHCTSPAAGALGWTDDRHKKVNHAIAVCYDLHKQLAIDLKDYIPGQPIPLSVSSFAAATAQIKDYAAMVPTTSILSTLFQSAAQKAEKAGADMLASIVKLKGGV